MKTERTAEFINTETIIAISEYFLILCRSIEVVDKNEEVEKVNEQIES